VIAKRGSVFVVDDDPSVRRSLKRLMSAAGYDARVFSSAEEMLALEGWPSPCCLVVDINMPGMTGLDLLERLRRDGSQAPVILISGYADPVTIARARTSGATAFLAKPFAASALLAQVEQALLANPNCAPSDFVELEREGNR
jgi:FixJ family two-component response regulator